MPDLRAKIRWTIPGAGTAFTVLHFGLKHGGDATTADAQEVIDRCDAFITAIQLLIPNVVTLQTNSEVEQIDIPTGGLQQVLAGTAAAAKTGSASSTAAWAAPAGAVISWTTDGIVRNRRVRGRTFIVPITAASFQTDGTLQTSTLTTLGTAAGNLRASGTNTELIVYNRPDKKKGYLGDGYVVKSHRIPDMVAVLRSRRS